MKGWNLRMNLPNYVFSRVLTQIGFSQLQLAKLYFQTEIQLVINTLCKWIRHSLEILAVSSNQDLRIYKLLLYLCYRNFTSHSDCLGLVVIPEIYKYVTSVNLVHNISSTIRRAAQRSIFAGTNITPSFPLSILVPVLFPIFDVITLVVFASPKACMIANN